MSGPMTSSALEAVLAQVADDGRARVGHGHDVPQGEPHVVGGRPVGFPQKGHEACPALRCLVAEKAVVVDEGLVVERELAAKTEVERAGLCAWTSRSASAGGRATVTKRRSAAASADGAGPGCRRCRRVSRLRQGRADGDDLDVVEEHTGHATLGPVTSLLAVGSGTEAASLRG